MSIGNNIRNLRELKNLTQTHMAEALNMSVSGYGKIERDETEITIARLKEIAKVLEVDYSQVLEFDKSNVFNIHDNHHTNGIGIIQNQQVNQESKLEELLQQVIKDNQDFKQQILEIMKVNKK